MKLLIATLLASVLILQTAQAAPEEPLQQNAKLTTEVTAATVDPVMDSVLPDISEVPPNLEAPKKHGWAKDDMTNFDPGNMHGSWPDALIPILGIIFVFGAPVLLVGIVMLVSFRKTRLQHDTINKFIESGQEIPADLFASLQTKATPKSNLHKGLMLCGAGAGICLAGFIWGNINISAIAMIPFFIGAAQLLIWKLEKNTETSLK
ncbi:MAG: DUF6249 domain-containing protein [Pseudomonadales bacterium]